MIETQVQDIFVREATRLGIWAFRVCAEAKRGRVPGAPKGTFDLCLPDLGWMEFKMRGKKMSPEQIEFQSRCRRRGVREAVITEGDGGTSEMVTRAIKLALAWRAEEGMPRRVCPSSRCPLEERL
jgi:hypothetical protein